jgi:hypothetical protein
MDEELWRAHKRRSAGPNLWRGQDASNNNNNGHGTAQEHRYATHLDITTFGNYTKTEKNNLISFGPKFYIF